MRTYTSKSAIGPQKDLAGLCPYKGTTFEYSGVNQASPVRNDFQKANKAAAGLTAQQQNKRLAQRNKERRENFTEEEEAADNAKHAEYQQRVGLPVRRFKKAASKAGMPKAAIDATVRDFQRIARLAKNKGEPTPNADDYLKIIKKQSSTKPSPATSRNANPSPPTAPGPPANSPSAPSTAPSAPSGNRRSRTTLRQ